MKVTIDIHRMISERKHGVGTYIKELSNNLIRRGKFDYDFAFFDKNSQRGYRQIAQQILNVSDEQLLECTDYECSNLQSGQHFYLSFCEAIKTKSDIVHLTSFVGAYPHIVKDAACPIVLTIHDVFGCLGFEHYFYKLPPMASYHLTCLLNNVLSARNNVKQIIVDSYYTKKCLIELFPHLEQRIHTIHLSYNKNIFYKDIQGDKKGDAQAAPYFLQVCRLTGDKNIFGTISAFFIVCEKNKDIRLSLIGNPDMQIVPELFEKFGRNKFFDRIDFRFDVNDSNDLRKYYSESIALVFPSFHEGFGLPIIEAQACGCPVIASNVTSCPEIAGDGGILVDPYDVESIADAMERVLSDTELRNNLIQKGYENIKRFSWDVCAAQTEEVYRRAYECK